MMKLGDLVGRSSLLRGGFGVTVLLVSGALGFACSAGGGPGGSGATGGNGAGATSGAGATGATGGTDPIIPIPDSGTSVNDAGLTCDAMGNCTCISIGMMGRLPTYGAIPGQDNTSAFQQWLNSKSSAAVDVVTTDTPLTPEFLGKYDVLVFQALEDREGGPLWTFTAEEKANLEAWLRAGGGLITLTGYGAQATEVNPTNELVAFTGLSYKTDDILPNCPAGDSCCYCAGSSAPMRGFNPSHPISEHISVVGAFHGRSVNAPADALIVASEGTLVYGATKELDAGRIFMFADEWVTYTSQWMAGGGDASCRTDPNHSCYGRTPDLYYQVPQFWYNALVWASGNAACFDIEDPAIIR
jgi:hypothetical protein